MLLLADILMGDVFERVAVPSLKEKTKSAESNTPLPLFVLKTGSLNVMVAEPLFDAIDKVVNVGGDLSFNFAVLFVCAPMAGLPAPSKTAPSAKATLSTSLPLGMPARPIPKV